MEFQQARALGEGSFREEHERVAIRRIAQHPPRIARPLVPVESFDEFRPDALEQEIREWHRRHFTLDHEAEARRQHRHEHEAIEVARMVRDHDALGGRQARGMPHREPQADDDEPAAGRVARRAAPQAQGRQQQHAVEHAERDRQEC